jgi:predicted transcriptional regulator
MGKKFEQVQMDLFADVDTKKVKKEPRPKDKPANNKGTEASASVFGWRFQVVVGIILSFINIETLASVEIEGTTEDIELHFNDRKTEYIQVKSMQGDILQKKNASKATDAMNTLINTSNITKGDYSKIVYVANFENPLSYTNKMLNAEWTPNRHEAYIRNYYSLTKKGQTFIDERVKKAQSDLAKNYDSSVQFFDKNKLYIGTVLFRSDEDDSTRNEILKETIDSFFERINLRQSWSKVRNIENMMVNDYITEASSKANTERHERITKERLVWKIIFQIIDEEPQEYRDNVPISVEGEVDKYEEYFIKQQVQNIEIINKVLAGLNTYASSHIITRENCMNFVNLKWKEYVDFFPLPSSGDEVVQEYGVKLIMLKVIAGNHIISKIKRGVNLE